jgi:hypothetical protein
MESELKASTAFAPWIVGAALVLGVPALGTPDDENTPRPQGSLTTTLPQTAPVDVEGYIELRPSWVPMESSLRFENNAYLGARFGNGWLLAYRQDFVNELASGQSGAVALGDGWIEYSAYPAVEAGPFTLNAEFHGIVPVAEAADEMRFLFGARSYFEGILAVTPRFGLFSRLMPRMNVFGSGPTAVERQRFENQFEFGPYVTFFSDRLVVRALARWTAGSVEAAGESPRWVHELRLTPEVLYQVSPDVVVGVGECSGSVVDDQFGGKAEALSEAFRKSMWQLIVQVTL